MHASRFHSLSLDLTRAHTHIPPLVPSSPFARSNRDLTGATASVLLLTKKCKFKTGSADLGVWRPSEIRAPRLCLFEVLDLKRKAYIAALLLKQQITNRRAVSKPRGIIPCPEAPGAEHCPRQHPVLSAIFFCIPSSGINLFCVFLLPT